MLLSMTGFGRSESTHKQQDIIVELKSINSKFLDLKLRLPQKYREKELGIRQIISPIAQRGKIDVSIDVINRAPEGNFSFNRELFKSYFHELKSVSDELGIEQGDMIQSIIRMPNIVIPAQGSIDEEEWAALGKAIKMAMANLSDFRSTEGKVIEADFELRVTTIIRLLEEVSPLVIERKDQMRERLRQNFEEYVTKGAIDENRFEQELLYYLEKMDITEEQVRLSQHCKYFLEELGNKKKVKGRKLNFITQEMGREINTLGSKANHSKIQHIVVQMKDELEKIKEQLANTL
ncbi:MAG: YicC/YloC family endoribonuclease [Saprospiraceae bacterium]